MQNNNKGKKVVLKLEQNNYKTHQGKAWIAKIDPDTKKIIEFVKPDNVEHYRSTYTYKWYVLNTSDKTIYRFSARHLKFDGTIEEFINDENNKEWIMKIEENKDEEEREQAIKNIKKVMKKYNIKIEEPKD